MVRKTLAPGVALVTLQFLAACATPATPAPESLNSPLVGRISAGSVLTIRPVAIPLDDPSFEMILTLLGDQPATSPPDAVEILVRRANGSVSSLVEPSDATALFPRGQSVSIVEAADTVLKPDEASGQR